LVCSSIAAPQDHPGRVHSGIGRRRPSRCRHRHAQV